MTTWHEQKFSYVLNCKTLELKIRFLLETPCFHITFTIKVSLFFRGATGRDTDLLMDSTGTNNLLLINLQIKFLSTFRFFGSRERMVGAGQPCWSAVWIRLGTLETWDHPLGPVGSSSSQHRRTPEIVLEKGHASFWIKSSPPVEKVL